MSRLTDAQIYTLRRMWSGQIYLSLADAKQGLERRGSGYRIHDVNSPSLPVLIRLGYVEFKNNSREAGKWYYVQLTEKGREAAKTLKITTD